ncbi:MAG: carboxylesterase family protein [Gammaproteobacteria bacterium]|nr:carboxylesterase family protein [Gammaproteobacteria bacterium]MXW51504.1 carboxylesterase family protein [Gammaproteobacteria bacterium]MXY05072.1 carboxylesterase family protein [Gammaproteobacteria bacterium]MYE52842.1 carboxylesterase family protein [Gammaproteobacteria bacterium]MYE86798.1 carboxylesterase family protein [Gammaproteobacteria bacterium]
MRRQALLVFAVAVLFWVSAAGAGEATPAPKAKPAQDANDPVVTTRLGKVRGTRGVEGVLTFLGIPYATPPVGDRRWRAPAPAKAWSGERDATLPGPICPQKIPRRYRSAIKVSEDCLYVNVWAPDPASPAPRPVMVWIHGGGFASGYGSAPIYDGTALAARGVVVVTFNYRLNVLGALVHPVLTRESEAEVSGNYHLQDQLAVLRWVQENIGAFGGDPSNVTLFGESAGGTSAMGLMTSPLAAGLFHRVISQSGVLRSGMRDLSEAHQQGREVVRQLGMTEVTSAALRGVDWRRLIRVVEDLDAFSRPIVDGRLLKARPDCAFRHGRQLDVPLILGFNAREEALRYTFAPELLPKDAGEFRAWAEDRFGGDADALLAQHPVEGGDYLESVVALETLRRYAAPTRLAAHWMEQVPSNAYLYVFSRVPPDPAFKPLAASHAAEIRYVFGTHLQGEEQGGGVAPAGVGNPELLVEADGALVSAIQRYWVQFAKTGNPNEESLPHWPPYRRAIDQHLKLDASIAMGQGFGRPGARLIEDRQAQQTGGLCERSEKEGKST